MTFADLPPSSSATRFTVAEASSLTLRPARVEPVKETMSTSGCWASASPTTAPLPDTRLYTPAGRPMSSAISARMCAERGATSLGLCTTVHPASSAGAILAIVWWSG